MHNHPINPYLNFDGRCEEALEFYRAKLGAEVAMLLRFKDNPDAATPGAVPPGTENKVLHATFHIRGSEIMASDCHCSGTTGFQGFSLAFSVADEADANSVFAALGEGGTVQMPLGKTFWSPCFGVITDRFGITWMISAVPEANSAQG
jgi:PhnB protein